MEKAIPIQSTEGSHFGFMLVSGNESESGECVFMFTPKNAESLECPEFQYLEQFGAKAAGEHKWRRENEKVSIELSTGDQAIMNLSEKTLTFNGDKNYRITTK